MDIEIPRPDGSLGLLYLAGALRKIGVEADILDAAVGTDEDTLEDTFHRREMQPNGLTKIGMSWERIREVIASRAYNIVGIDCKFTPQTRMALKVAQICKEVSPETFVIAGGVNARNLRSRFLKDGWVDIICLTEGEKIILEIVQRFMENQGMEGIAGTIFRGERRRRETFPARPDSIITNMDDLPMPAWDKLPLLKYRKVASPHAIDYVDGQVTYAPLMTSRGCPFQCSYCHISNERFGRGVVSGDIGNLRVKSVNRVLAEIEILISLGVEKVYIEDDSFLARKKRVQDIARGFAQKNLRFSDVNGVNIAHLFKPEGGRLVPDKEYLELLFSAGLTQLLLPIESGSRRILHKYATNKVNLDIHDVPWLFRVATQEVGMVCPTNIMIGFPDETEEEIMMSVDMAKRLIDAGAVSATFFVPTPYPGSRLFGDALRGRIIDGRRIRYLEPDFDTDRMNWKHPIMQNTTVSPERIAEIFQESWWGINPPEYVTRRTEESIGRRWQSGAPDKK
jgi:radical SAM superfamily enzyme YgiQ (UPF0313 family)